MEEVEPGSAAAPGQHDSDSDFMMGSADEWSEEEASEEEGESSGTSEGSGYPSHEGEESSSSEEGGNEPK